MGQKINPIGFRLGIIEAGSNLVCKEKRFWKT